MPVPRLVRSAPPCSGARPAAALLLALALALPAAAHAALPASPSWSHVSGRTNQQLGRTVATAGDVNGDGYSDVIVTESGSAAGGGAAYLYLGGPGGNLFDASRLAWRKVNFPVGPQAAGVGDLNGDGFDDVAVAWNNTVRVYYGSASGLDTTSFFQTTHSAGTPVTYGAVPAPAGDVNGDGYPDLVIGLGEVKCAISTNGVVYVYYGGPSGLSEPNSTLICPGSYLGNFGASVCTAGDVDGDGYTDIVVGAPHAALGGEVYLYRGGPGGIAAVPATVLDADQSGAQLGASVGTAGDVNGDGYADVIVGAPYEDFSTLTDTGEAMVFLGGPSGLATTPSWFEDGPQANAHFGASVGTAGDVNGDGYADVIVGSPGYTNGETDEGQFAVFPGGPGGVQPSSYFPESDNSFAALGAWVATAGDVNGDGFSDVIVAAPTYTNTNSAEGAVFVYAGGADMPNPAIPVSTLLGAVSNENWGTSVAAGDFNGDGVADVAIGAPGMPFKFLGVVGGVQLFPGGASGPQAATGSFSPAIQNSGLGTSVALAGDMNADGFADLAVGAVSRSAVDSGAVYLFRGNSAGSLGTPATLRAPGPRQGDSFGASVAWADVNGDGLSDLIVGSPTWTGPLGANQGRVFVYMASPSGIGTNQAAALELDGTQADERFGASVANAGDVNRDGLEDVVIGAPGWDFVFGRFSVPDEGRVGVYLGGAHGLATSPAVVLAGTGSFENMGASVAGAGDLNGDGYGDVAAGAPGGDQVAVLFGAANANGGTATIAGPQSGARFGACVAAAGDLDADGHSDLLVGAPLHDGTTGVDEGRVYAYLGSAGGTFGGPAWFKEGGAAGANLGAALGAGEVTADAFPDVIVGAPQYTGAATAEGYVQTFAGDRGSLNRNLTALSASFANLVTPQTTAGGPPARFGLSVRGRSPAGRATMRLEWRCDQVAYGTQHLSGATAWVATASPGTTMPLDAAVTGLGSGLPYAWQARTRTRNVLFPAAPWQSAGVLGRGVYALLTGPIPLAVGPDAAAGLALAPPAPNPFTRGAVALSFTLPAAGPARLRVLDVAGREVRRLADGWLDAGPHLATWDGRDAAGMDAAPGVYFARLERGARAETRRLVRLR